MQFVGVDVSKDKLDCLWIRDPEKLKIKSKKIKNSLKGFAELSTWLLKTTQAPEAQICVAMEATGIYHEQLAIFLHKRGFRVCVINPAQVKAFIQSLGKVHKTDKADSLGIALFALKNIPEQWKPASEEVRVLKALIGRLEALESDLQREQNRLEKSQVSDAPDFVLNSLHEMIDRLKAEKKRLVKQIDDHIDRHPGLKRDRKLLQSIPCVGPVISAQMLTVLCGRDFKNAGQVAAYLGLIPKISESGKWKGRSRLSKRGPANIRKKLYMPAVKACRDNPDIAKLSQRLLSNGKCKMQVIGAAMRKLVQICFGVVKHQSEYRSQVQIAS